MSTPKLIILANEAMRQRSIDAMWAGVSGVESLEDVHGDYTAGFYEKQREKLKRSLDG